MGRAASEPLIESMPRVLPARTIVNPMSMQSSKDFGRLLLECVDRTFENLLGSKVRDAAYLVLEKDYIPRIDIPLSPDEFSFFLEQTFGVAGKTIGRAIARCFYSELGLNFREKPEFRFHDYIRAARP